MSVVGYVLNIVCHPFRRCANLMWCMAQQWHDVDRSFLVLDHHSQVLLDRGVNLSEPARGEHKRIHWRQQAVAFNLLTYAWVATTTFSFLLWLSGFGNGSNKWEEGHWLHFWSLSLRTDIFICIGCKLSRRPFRNIFNGILTKDREGRRLRNQQRSDVMPLPINHRAESVPCTAFSALNRSCRQLHLRHHTLQSQVLNFDEVRPLMMLHDTFRFPNAV